MTRKLPSAVLSGRLPTHPPCREVQPTPSPAAVPGSPIPARDISPESYAKPFCDFMTANPTVFHAVDSFASRLRDHGYEHLSERDTWTKVLKPGGKYYCSRNGSSLIAFAIGKDYQSGNGVGVVAGHVDALAAKL